MPSLRHEALLLLFRNRSELAPELLREALGVDLPAYTEVRIESANLNDVVPAEYTAEHGCPACRRQASVRNRR